jgi:hypothetical protein
VQAILLERREQNNIQQPCEHVLHEHEKSEFGSKRSRFDAPPNTVQLYCNAAALDLPLPLVDPVQIHPDGFNSATARLSSIVDD